MERDIEIVCGDGRKGYEQEAPYDVIHVGAGNLIRFECLASEKIPQALID